MRVRDAYEIALLRAFVAQGKPVLGVCRGAQIINVAHGGTLYQDIATQHPAGLSHRNWAMYERNCHATALVPGTPLARLYPDTRLVKTNSVHHQAVKDLGRDLVVEAWSEPDRPGRGPALARAVVRVRRAVAPGVPRSGGRVVPRRYADPRRLPRRGGQSQIGCLRPLKRSHENNQSRRRHPPGTRSMPIPRARCAGKFDALAPASRHGPRTRCAPAWPGSRPFASAWLPSTRSSREPSRRKSASRSGSRATSSTACSAGSTSSSPRRKARCARKRCTPTRHRSSRSASPTSRWAWSPTSRRGTIPTSSAPTCSSRRCSPATPCSTSRRNTRP